MPQFGSDVAGQNDSAQYLRTDFCNPSLAEQRDGTKGLDLFFFFSPPSLFFNHTALSFQAEGIYYDYQSGILDGSVGSLEVEGGYF